MREALGAVRKSFLGPNPIVRVQKNCSARPPVRFNHPPRPIRRARPLRVWQVRYDAELGRFAEQFCWNRLQKVAYRCTIAICTRPDAEGARARNRARFRGDLAVAREKNLTFM